MTLEAPYPGLTGFTVDSMFSAVFTIFAQLEPLLCPARFPFSRRRVISRFALSARQLNDNSHCSPNLPLELCCNSR